MANETIRLAQYASALHYEDIPSDVIERAKQCITDTIAVIISGYDLPWSRMIAAYAQKSGPGGKSRILGPETASVQAPAAALTNGALAHAFEMDNLTWPSTGVHPGATLLSSALALAQERGIGGCALVTGFVAGSEIMIRIGRATLHHNEERGFHAPGTTGPFGAAIACGRILGFDVPKMTNAIGIAGSLACGLLEFARSGTGAMVKRLHLGRAAESGVLAASLADAGFTGPVSVLEGEYGYLNVYCGEHDVGELTRGLGESYATRQIMLKRFPCHITAHTSVQAIEDLRAEHGYAPEDVVSIEIGGNQRMATVNNIAAPTDIMMAQYSIPFCVALAHVRDPRDPRSYDQRALDDPRVRSLMERISIVVAENRPTPLAANVTVTLKDGRELSRSVAGFKGTPEQPLTRVELRDKFLLLTDHCDRRAMATMFDRLQNLENEPELDWIAV
jgi:2-methylcitrate dehydratase PrpD